MGVSSSVRWVACLGLVLVMGASLREDWVRRGNAAYAGGAYATAVECYARAEATAADPGLVAFNTAAAQYQLQAYAAAAASYRCALEDAGGVRRVRALYGLANSLVRHSEGEGPRAAVALLREALAHYQDCLRLAATLAAAESAAVQQTRADAEHNSLLVEQVLAQRQAELKEERSPPGPGGGPPRASTKPRRDPRSRPGGEPGDTEPANIPDQPSTAAPPDGPVHPTQRPAPGKGNLPPIVDDTEARPLGAQQAHDYLQQAMQRLHDARTQWLLSAPIGSAGDRDW